MMEEETPKWPKAAGPPAEHKLLLRFGPYRSQGLLTHRVKELLPLKEHLEAVGFDVHLEEINEEDALEIFLDGKFAVKGDVRSYNLWSPSTTAKTVSQIQEKVALNEEKAEAEKESDPEAAAKLEGSKRDPDKGRLRAA